MTKRERDLVELLWERDEAARAHHSMRTGRDMPKPFTLEGMAAQEIERLRDCLESIKRHVDPHAETSALARAVVATCDSGLNASPE